VRDVAADLAAAFGVFRARPAAVADAVEAADPETRLRRQAAAVADIDPRLVVAQALREADAAAGDLARLADVVDDASRRAGGQRAGRAAAQHFQAVEAAVGAQPGVGGGEGDVAELQDRQAVFLELDVARAAGRNGDAAHADVGVAFAAARFRAQAGNRTQDFGRAGRRVGGDAVALERADRDAGTHLGRLVRRAGDDDAVELQAVAAGGGGRSSGRRGSKGCGSGRRRCCSRRWVWYCGRYCGRCRSVGRRGLGVHGRNGHQRQRDGCGQRADSRVHGGTRGVRGASVHGVSFRMGSLFRAAALKAFCNRLHTRVFLYFRRACDDPLSLWFGAPHGVLNVAQCRLCNRAASSALAGARVQAAWGALSRTTRCTGSVRGGAFSPRSKACSAATSSVPASATGWCTEVSGGSL